MYEVRDIGNHQVEVYDRDTGRGVYKYLLPTDLTMANVRINGNEFRAGPINNQQWVYDLEAGQGRWE